MGHCLIRHVAKAGGHRVPHWLSACSNDLQARRAPPLEQDTSFRPALKVPVGRRPDRVDGLGSRSGRRCYPLDAAGARPSPSGRSRGTGRTGTGTVAGQQAPLSAWPGRCRPAAAESSPGAAAVKATAAGTAVQTGAIVGLAARGRDGCRRRGRGNGCFPSQRQCRRWTLRRPWPWPCTNPTARPGQWPGSRRRSARTGGRPADGERRCANRP